MKPIKCGVDQLDFSIIPLVYTPFVNAGQLDAQSQEPMCTHFQVKVAHNTTGHDKNGIFESLNMQVQAPAIKYDNRN